MGNGLAEGVSTIVVRLNSLKDHGYVHTGVTPHEYEAMLPHRISLKRDQVLHLFDHIEETGISLRPWTVKPDFDLNEWRAMFESEVDLITARLITG